MSVSHRNAAAAAEWAAKQREARERAKRMRQEREAGIVGEQHTFQPK